MVEPRLKPISDLKQGSCSISHNLETPPRSNPVPSHCSHGPLVLFLDKHQDSFSFVSFCLGRSIIVMNGCLFPLCSSPLSHCISQSFMLPQFLCGLRELVMDMEAWHAAVHRVSKSRTRQSD